MEKENLGHRACEKNIMGQGLLHFLIMTLLRLRDELVQQIFLQVQQHAI